MNLTAAFAVATEKHPAGVWSAPGRVNLIGEHTDYNQGLVLPLAISARTAVAGGPRTDGLAVIHFLQPPQPTVSVSIDDLAPGRPVGAAAYPAGVLWALREDGCHLPGMDLMVDGRVPIGAGLSSSAALECATALAAVGLAGLDVDPAHLAVLAQRAENEFVGVPCGVMDQMASMLARPGHVLFIDVRTGDREHVPFDPSTAGLALLVINTHASHAHAEGAYAERRHTAEHIATRLGVPALRDVSIGGLPQALEQLADSPIQMRRLRHVVTENERVLAAVDLLRDGRLGDLGRLLTASHLSLRDDYEVSSPELDTAVDAALGAGALGARMTGGGFGGCAIALVPEPMQGAVIRAVVDAASDAGHPVPTVDVAIASAGAHEDLNVTTRSRPQEQASSWQQ